MKVKRKNIPPEYQDMVHDDMSYQEVQALGTVIIRMKIMSMKQHWHDFWHHKRWKK